MPRVYFWHLRCVGGSKCFDTSLPTKTVLKHNVGRVRWFRNRIFSMAGEEKRRSQPCQPLFVSSANNLRVSTTTTIAVGGKISKRSLHHHLYLLPHRLEELGVWSRSWRLLPVNMLEHLKYIRFKIAVCLKHIIRLKGCVLNIWPNYGLGINGKDCDVGSKGLRYHIQLIRSKLYKCINLFLKGLLLICGTFH